MSVSVIVLSAAVISLGLPLWVGVVGSVGVSCISLKRVPVVSGQTTFKARLQKIILVDEHGCM